MSVPDPSGTRTQPRVVEERQDQANLKKAPSTNGGSLSGLGEDQVQYLSTFNAKPSPRGDLLQTGPNDYGQTNQKGEPIIDSYQFERADTGKSLSVKMEGHDLTAEKQKTVVVQIEDAGLDNGGRSRDYK